MAMESNRSLAVVKAANRRTIYNFVRHAIHIKCNLYLIFTFKRIMPGSFSPVNIYLYRRASDSSEYIKNPLFLSLRFSRGIMRPHKPHR